jgi:hypothetical protein
MITIEQLPRAGVRMLFVAGHIESWQCKFSDKAEMSEGEKRRWALSQQINRNQKQCPKPRQVRKSILLRLKLWTNLLKPAGPKRNRGA